MEKRSFFGHIMALFTVLVWGTTFVFSKKLMAVLTAEQLMVLRFAIAYTVLWVLRPRWTKPVLRQEGVLALMGLLGNTLYFMAENNALNYTYAANVSILVAAAPVFTAVLAHFFVKGERITKWSLLGFAVAFIGVALVVLGGTFALKLSPVGDVLSIAAALLWAVYSILLKRVSAHTDNIIAMRKVMFYGLITGLPVMLIQGRPLPFEELVSFEAIGSLAFLGVIGSGICYVLWGEAAKRLGIVATNNYIYIIPFVTLVASWLMLAEAIHWSSLVGAVLIVGGIFAASRYTGRGPKQN